MIRQDGLRFSANLGFLYAEHALPDAIRAAARDGFDAVECHWPYDSPAEEIREALRETGLPMLGLNTVRGDVAKGDNGLAALVGREAEARVAIDQAIAYADAIDCRAIHVMAGRAAGGAAEACFAENLRYAVSRTDRMILIEPLNPHDAPGYFLSGTAQARALIEAVAAPNLRLMFDCYHIARSEGDVLTRFRQLLPVIGHVQFAGVPDRGRPDLGEIDYRWLLSAMADEGWSGPFGAEYRPSGDTTATLDWMRVAKR